ncbi:nuclear transport factor 2 family protein [Streptomyces sp. NPDC048277]|uniref:nuclear transport factor 2 family protein n=1 Tax=Streptomyces sp. NPDC048277 TaxID=3155027 RepID=UPI00340569D5
MTADDRLAALAAKDAIRDVLHSYSRGLDRMDRALAESVWHGGGTADYGPAYRGSATGFLDFVWPFHAGFRSHSHLVANEFIRLDLSSGTATSETYVAVWLQTAPEDGFVTDQIHRGRYLDRWSLRDGRWAIDHRDYVGDMFHEARHADHSPGPDMARRGARDASDLSYALFGAPGAAQSVSSPSSGT